MIQCDPAITAVIEKINGEHSNGFIKERLDDEHLLILSERMEELKDLLKSVSSIHYGIVCHC